MIRKIFFAYDGSDSAKKALNTALVFRRLLLGSVSKQVVQYADRMVLAVR